MNYRTLKNLKLRPTIHEQELTAEDEQQSLLRVEQLLEQASQQNATYVFFEILHYFLLINIEVIGSLAHLHVVSKSAAAVF